MATYLRLREVTCSPPSVLRFEEVDAYAEHCSQPRCKGNRRSLAARWYRDSDGRWRCRECKRLRVYERIQVLRSPGGSRDRDAEPARDRLAELGLLFTVLTLHELVLLGLRVRFGRAGLLDRLRECEPFGPWTRWSEREASNALRSVRRRVEERIEALERRSAA